MTPDTLRPTAIADVPRPSVVRPMSWATGGFAASVEAGRAMRWIELERWKTTYTRPSGPTLAAVGRARSGWFGSAPRVIRSSALSASNSKSFASAFQRARTTSELGAAPSGMNASSSPLSGKSGEGSRNAGWPAASGPGFAPGRSPPRHVGSATEWSMTAGASSVGAVMRQKPALWSDTHTLPSGATIAPVEMCRPSP
jgi:hypothetical protein